MYVYNKGDKKVGEKEMKKLLWYNPKSRSNFRKQNLQETNIRNVYGSTDKRLSKHDRLIQAARKMNSLANVQQDQVTKQKARSLAVYFFRKAKEKK